MSRAVRLDLWPAELRADPDAPDPEDRRHLYPVRVVVTLEEVLVFKDGSPPSLVLRDALVSYAPPVPPHRQTPAQRRTPGDPLSWAVVTTDSGHALTFRRASGCGCGSRLKLMSLASLFAVADATVTTSSIPDDGAFPTPTPAPFAASTKDRP